MPLQLHEIRLHELNPFIGKYFNAFPPMSRTSPIAALIGTIAVSSSAALIGPVEIFTYPTFLLATLSCLSSYLFLLRLARVAPTAGNT